MATDLELLERIKKGDEQAFEKVFRTYYKSLCLFSNRILHDPPSSEEVVEDIFFNLWERRDKFDITTSLKSYLFRSAYNNSLKLLRHQKIVANYESRMVEEEPQYQLQENYLEIGEITHSVLKTLDQVPERTRMIFQMNRDEGLKYQEIADKMNISVKTVEAHMTSILKLLRENLRDFIPILIFLNFLAGLFLL